MHGGNECPLVGLWLITLSSVETHVAIKASHGVNKIAEDCHTDVATPGVHWGHLVPGFLDWVKTLNTIEIVHTIEPPNDINKGMWEGEGGTISGHASQDLTVCSCSHSPQRASEFCKNSARSLVALYHEGALPCECHPAGATGHPAAPRAGSARAGPMSSGGSVPAVRRASTGSRTANVSAYLGRPKSSLVQADEAHPGQGLSSFTVLETHLGICESADPESGGLGWGLRVYISRSHSEDSHATGPGTTF